MAEVLNLAQGKVLGERVHRTLWSKLTPRLLLCEGNSPWNSGVNKKIAFRTQAFYWDNWLNMKVNTYFTLNSRIYFQ